MDRDDQERVIALRRAGTRWKDIPPSTSRVRLHRSISEAHRRLVAETEVPLRALFRELYACTQAADAELDAVVYPLWPVDETDEEWRERRNALDALVKEVLLRTGVTRVCDRIEAIDREVRAALVQRFGPDARRYGLVEGPLPTSAMQWPSRFLKHLLSEQEES